MNQPLAKFIVIHYNEPLEWLYQYTNNYWIINKGDPITDINIDQNKVVQKSDQAGDIERYFAENYLDLPELMLFAQGNPFDSCKREMFEHLMWRDHFTCLESVDWPPYWTHHWDYQGGFREDNTVYSPSTKYHSVDDFMFAYFKNYNHPATLRFCPGEEYIVEKWRVLHYPREFWQKIADELPVYGMELSHLIERTLWMIFQCDLELKENYGR